MLVYWHLLRLLYKYKIQILLHITCKILLYIYYNINTGQQTYTKIISEAIFSTSKIFTLSKEQHIHNLKFSKVVRKIYIYFGELNYTKRFYL